jgi:hypothetical protein
LILKAEPKNSEPLIFYVRPFVRLAGKRSNILDQCLKFVEAAIEISPTRSDLKIELAYIRSLQGQVKLAKQYYEEAANDNRDDIRAIEGMIRY